jgi:hypothetical protein
MLGAAVAAWAGIYSPLSTAYVGDETKKPLQYSTKEKAEVCMKRTPQNCLAESSCKKMTSGRCLPKDTIVSTDGKVRLNNSVTYDVYVEVDRVSITDDDGIKINDVPLMHSESTNILVVPFRTGKVRTLHALQSESFAYYEALKPTLLTHEAAQIVLCGHSEGGVTAEVVAYICAEDPDMEGVIGKMYMVNSGNHLWMNSEQRDAIKGKFDGRFVSYVSAAVNEHGVSFYDAYCTTLCLGDVEGLVSLPKTVLVTTQPDEPGEPDALTVLEVDDAADLQKGYIPSDTVISSAADGQTWEHFHMWSKYENKIKSSLANQSGGLRKTDAKYMTWALLLVVTVASSLLPR